VAAQHSGAGRAYGTNIVNGISYGGRSVLSLGGWDYAAIPAEYFVQLGLRIKAESHPRHALVVSCANGRVCYVPHREVFLRGGYETTFTESAALAPEAGDMLADAAVGLIRSDEAN